MHNPDKKSQVSQGERVGNFERGAEAEQVREVTVRPSVLFELVASDDALRELMYYIQQEGILTQNTISESRAPGAKDIKMHLWVDEEDKELIQRWLREKGFPGV